MKIFLIKIVMLYAKSFKTVSWILKSNFDYIQKQTLCPYESNNVRFERSPRLWLFFIIFDRFQQNFIPKDVFDKCFWGLLRFSFLSQSLGTIIY